MPETYGKATYYRTVEVCRLAGISRNTLFNWLKAGVCSEPEKRDWRGWRLYSQAQLEEIKARTQQSFRVEEMGK